MATNDEVVEELLANSLFLDTFANMRDRFKDIPSQVVGELLVVGVLYERGMITRGDDSE